MTTVMQETKDAIVRALDNPKLSFRGMASVAEMQSHFGVDAGLESDRPLAWRIAQAMAEMSRGPLPVLVPVDNRLARTYRFR